MESSNKTLSSGGYEQIGTGAPTLEEPAEVFPAEFIALVVVQLGPLPVLVAHQGQAVVGDDAVSLVFKLKAVIDV